MLPTIDSYSRIPSSDQRTLTLSLEILGALTRALKVLSYAVNDKNNREVIEVAIKTVTDAISKVILLP